MPKMGTKQTTLASVTLTTTRASMSEALFSGTRLRLFALLFGQPYRSFYANELIGLTRSGSGAVQRDLVRLSQSGLVSVTSRGSQKHYQANPRSPIFAELCSVAQKTVGLAEPIRQALAPLSTRIRAAFVFGSVAKRQDTAVSDVDLMVLTDELGYGELFSALESVNTWLGRTVNPTILTQQEFAKRAKGQEAFLTRVLAQPKIWVIGGEDELAI